MESVMTNSIYRAIGEIGSWLQEFQVKRFLVAVMVGFLLLTTTIGCDSQNQDLSSQNRDLTSKVLDRVHQNDSDRPKTTGEWNREARQVEGMPGKRIERIGKESAEAVKEFGGVYPDTAKKSANELKEQTSR
jgi:hypothetical protein